MRAARQPVAERRSRAPRGLGLWILGPLLGLAAVWLAIMNLPGSNCDGYAVSDGGQKGLLLTVTMIASLGACGAALVRLREMRVSGNPAVSGAAVGGAVAIVALAAVVLALVAGLTLMTAGVYLAVLGTGVCLLFLVIAWIARRNVEQVGLVLPAYLLGAGLACYPLSTVFALAVESGALC